MNHEKKTFEYNYSSSEQLEIKRIREKYSYEKKEESSIERLRRLDEGVVKKAAHISVIVGVIGVLLLGIGMSFAMTDIGMGLGLEKLMSMAVGIAVGLIGIALVILSYPIYWGVIKRERKRIAPEIIRITDEIMK